MGIRGRLTGSLWDSDGGVCVIPRSVALCVQRCRGIVLVAVGATCGVFFDYWSGYDLCGAQYNVYEDGDDRGPKAKFGIERNAFQKFSSESSQSGISHKLQAWLFRALLFCFCFLSLQTLRSTTMDAMMRQAFVRLGFTQQGAVAVVNEQGISTIEELGLLTEDEIENLCKTIRRPGGTMVGQGQGNVPNPGTAVSLRAETNMKLATYWLKFRIKTSRVTQPGDIDLPAVRSIRGLRDWQKNHTALEAAENIINMKDWPKTMEAIVELLRGNLGVTGIPLAYVVREDEAVGADPVDGWDTQQDEMIGRAPIVNAAGNRTDTFITDNQRTWVIISEITRDKECWTYVKVAQRTRDGRMAFWSLYNHYLGPNAVDNMANMAERRLVQTTYDGEKKRWNFEKYMTVHTDAHHTLENLKRYGHAGIDNRSKVRHFIDGIKTTSLDAVKTRIMSDTVLRNDFDQCVTLYKDMIQQQTAQERKSLNVSVTETEGNDDKSGDRKKQNQRGMISADQVEDRFYDPKEYQKLTPDAKLKLKRMREKRGHTPKSKKQKATEVFAQEEGHSCYCCSGDGIAWQRRRRKSNYIGR